MKTFQSRLIKHTTLTDFVSLFQFSLPDDDSFTFIPGQYVIVHVPQKDKSPLRRLYSIASSPAEEKHIDLIVGMYPQGAGSTYLKDLNIGDNVTIQGPAGLFKIFEKQCPIICIATGTGIAPFRSMIMDLCNNQQFRKNPHPISLHWGVRTEKDIYLSDELVNLVKTCPNFTYKIYISRPDGEITNENKNQLRKGRITHSIDEIVNEGRTHGDDTDFYICGGREMVDDVKEYLMKKGVEKSHLHFEKY